MEAFRSFLRWLPIYTFLCGYTGRARPQTFCAVHACQLAHVFGMLCSLLPSWYKAHLNLCQSSLGYRWRCFLFSLGCSKILSQMGSIPTSLVFFSWLWLIDLMSFFLFEYTGKFFIWNFLSVVIFIQKGMVRVPWIEILLTVWWVSLVPFIKYFSGVKVHIYDPSFVEMGPSGCKFAMWAEPNWFWTQDPPVQCLLGPREGATSYLLSCMSFLSIRSNQVTLSREAVKVPLWPEGVLKFSYSRNTTLEGVIVCAIIVSELFLVLFLGKVLFRMAWRA